MPKPRRQRRKPRPTVALAAIKVLDERLRKVERAVGLDKRPIGFDATSVIGDRIELDPDDPEVEELP